MRERLLEILSDFKYAFIEKFTLFFSMGYLVFNLLIFALVMSEVWILSLVLAGLFFVYIPIGYYDKQEEFWITVSRILEIVTAFCLSLAYILLFKKFWLLFLPAIEIAGAVLFYVFIYRSYYPKEPKGRRRYY